MLCNLIVDLLCQLPMSFQIINAIIIDSNMFTLFFPDANIEESYQMKNIEILPSQGIDHEEISVKSTSSSKQFEYSAVMTSLPATLKWLRDCISDNPSLRLQVTA